MQEASLPSFRPTMTTQRPSHEPAELFPSNVNDFNLDNFRLPPGITLTRVQHGAPPPQHPQLPMRLVQSTSPQKASGGSSPIIVTSPLTQAQPNVQNPVPKAKDPSAPNVIVVDTRKIPSGPPPRMQSVAVQTGEDDDLAFSGVASLTKKQLKRHRRKERLQLEKEMAALQLSAPKAPEAAGKKKTKKKSSGTGTHSASSVGDDKWEENIFAPKSDLDLERGDMDDDERELEAFKRFCFNTVPPERKEKVRIQLNVKDIFGKTKSSTSSSCSSGSSSCKSST